VVAKSEPSLTIAGSNPIIGLFDPLNVSFGSNSGAKADIVGSSICAIRRQCSAANSAAVLGLV
jgi:hypothetical protein